MNATIFCSFDHQDMADLATGHIRRMRGVKNIQFLIDHAAREEREGSGATNATGDKGYGIPLQIYNARREEAVGLPPGPANIKIVCDDNVKEKVVAALVNLHAHRIVAVPN